jgi:Xaa-Pro aminopeptidase
MADPLPRAEHAARRDALQRRMARAGIDALLLTTPADVFYVTGFLTRFWESPARPWFVVLPAAGEPVAVIPAIGAPLMARTGLADIRTWPAPRPGDDGIGLLAETLRETVPQDGRVGVPMGAETHLRMPLADFEALRARLQPRAFTDATEIVHRVREIKSAAEIDAIRTICTIAGRAFDAVPARVREGQPLDAVFRDFQVSLLQEGADWVAYLAGGAGQGGYGDVISPAGPDPLRSGDVLMLDTGAVRGGYFCDFDRNFRLGPLDPDTVRAQHALFDATEAALDSARPGMTAADLHAVMHGFLTRAGVEPADGRLGHGLGLALTEWPSFTPLDRTPLRAGMVLTLEPGVTLGPGRMLVHEEVIALTETGATLLSPRAPRDMPGIGR